MTAQTGFSQMSGSGDRDGFRVTGKMVFWTITMFFVVVVGVNVVMAYLAVHTFGGVKTEAAYKLGLKYNENIAAAQAQEKLGWQVDTLFAQAAGGRRQITLSVRDRNGAPLQGLTARARLSSPTHPQDVDIAFAGAINGVFSSEFAAPAGQWELEVELLDGTARKYRSDNRIMLR